MQRLQNMQWLINWSMLIHWPSQSFRLIHRVIKWFTIGQWTCGMTPVAPAAPENVLCPVCKEVISASGSHHCLSCDKVMHAFCGIEVPGGAEGHGAARICTDCQTDAHKQPPADKGSSELAPRLEPMHVEQQWSNGARCVTPWQPCSLSSPGKQ